MTWDPPPRSFRSVVHDVRTYGAVGNGVADDTAAIQAAIDAAGPATLGMAGTVFFAPGIYMISAPLTVGPYNTASTVPVSYPSLVALSGDGLIGDGDSSGGSSPGAVTLRATAAFPLNTYLLTVNAPNNTVAPAGSWIKGLSVDCATRAAGVRLWQPRQFHCEDITIAHANPPGGYGAWTVMQHNASVPWRNRFDHIYVQFSSADGIVHVCDDFAAYYNPTVQNVTRFAYNIQTGTVLLDNPNYYQGAGTANSAIIYADVGGGAALLVRGLNFPGTGSGGTGGPNNAVQLNGTTATNHLPAVFEGCSFFNGPATGTTEPNAAMILIQNAGHSVPALFRDCVFIAGPHTSDWAYCAATTPFADLVTFEGCKFVGAPAVTPFNDATGNDRFRAFHCEGYNPIGLVTVAVPASAAAVAAVPYDRTVYVTAGTDPVTCAIANGPTIKVPAAACVPVFVPAGKTLTPTYTATHPPTWVVEGN